MAKFFSQDRARPPSRRAGGGSACEL